MGFTMGKATTTSRAFLLATALLFHLATTPSISVGQWVEGGFRVADSAYPSFLAQAEDGAGGSFLLWTGYGYTGDLDLFASRVTSEGRRPPGWPDGRVTVCAAPGVQLRAAAIPDGSGGVLVFWRDG
ncbi:MAG TPA: hypothetical protein VE326_07115, partial [Candidatus Binatia bacterium]|nr:hypothetical protein [Candidatus Binatia bacterium]